MLETDYATERNWEMQETKVEPLVSSRVSNT